MNKFIPLSKKHAILFVTNNIPNVSLPSLMNAEEISDGNLNIVYRISDPANKKSYIVKQAPPYIRIMGEGWPLTQDRIKIEFNALCYFKKYSKKNIVSVLHFDEKLSAIIMEDLSNFKIWRQVLIDNKSFTSRAHHIGSCMADIYYHSSDFYLSTKDKEQLKEKFNSPAMCATTAEVFFSDPYYDCDRNNINPKIMDLVITLWNHDKLRKEITSLEHKFNYNTEVLLHGDIHTGSIMVSEKECKLIDSEFAFFGPIGFDMGSLIGNLFLSYCTKINNYDNSHTHSLTEIVILWQTFSHNFKNKAMNQSNEAVIDSFLNNVWKDSLGYAGTEMIRRTIGVAKVSDFDIIKSPIDLEYSQRLSLIIGQFLILNLHKIKNPNELLNGIKSLKI
ncbi:S-methyl-5-thioribose kinase [Aliivibrio sp. S4TY2]|uniref:S-methyl-5-thioribose kinase n=1 Tax=unclassified Aliivibrio TaxID=2645654 RepID=UPI002379414F|nr:MULTISPECIES: S-methyl-5-thioribose kinase [unclassified Aliivibrio]MDD9158282.1 S-methyl-5-thioribose kinase [Aliivibrio sp. S4TY2]MDD9162197.1 S-methyl-5-thioribose kinase [Aliivibrio sp. S4TY1]MDD9166234.1 S-methyl-5-thioribose kinase [Aliivibrio sp. S4MY2]MDD9170233.1 S-methyl-5-thioribose kinase [Aliivibrio sp. S4MY4]MDD9187284.1 S-methyl-5-thioribose kinase [Aliivibrio sp. S4MY3]